MHIYINSVFNAGDNFLGIFFIVTVLKYLFLTLFFFCSVTAFWVVVGLKCVVFRSCWYNLLLPNLSRVCSKTRKIQITTLDIELCINVIQFVLLNIFLIFLYIHKIVKFSTYFLWFSLQLISTNSLKTYYWICVLSETLSFILYFSNIQQIMWLFLHKYELYFIWTYYLL